MGMNPRRNGENWRTSICWNVEWEETTPLGGDSKIIEEDPPF